MSHDDPNSPDLTTAQTAHFLSLGKTSGQRRVDELIARLNRLDGAAWVARHLPSCLDTTSEPPQTLFLIPNVDMATLDEMKSRSKTLFSEALHPDDRCAGMAGYFMAIAAALRWHGRMITDRSIEGLRDDLLDLAVVAPPPYDELFSQAAMVEPNSDLS